MENINNEITKTVWIVEKLINKEKLQEQIKSYKEIITTSLQGGTSATDLKNMFDLVMTLENKPKNGYYIKEWGNFNKAKVIDKIWELTTNGENVRMRQGEMIYKMGEFNTWANAKFVDNLQN